MTHNPETHLSQAEMDAIRGAYVRMPSDNAEPQEWMRWAREVDRHASTARLLLDEAEAKARGDR